MSRGYIGSAPASDGVYSLEEHYDIQRVKLGYSYGWTDYNGGFASDSISNGSLVTTAKLDASWGTIYAGKSRMVSLPMEFRLEFSLAWTGSGNNNAGIFLLALLDADGDPVIGGGFKDIWTGEKGTAYAFSGETIYGTVSADMPYSGDSAVVIKRTAAGVVSIAFDGVQRISATNIAAIKGLLISNTASTNASYPGYGVTFGEIARTV